MVLKKITDKFKGLTICEYRSNTDNYVELVFLNKEVEKWVKVFREVLGEPKKKAGVKPNKEVIRLTKPYGGVWQNQLVFKKEFDDTTVVVVMFWPWQDNIHTTLKMVLFKK